MLKKVNRLAKGKHIRAALQKGRTFFTPYFSVKFFLGSASPRFAVVVSTKVYKSAVKRNRLKRVIREWLRLNLKKLKPGDYMLMAKTKTAARLEKDLLADLAGLLIKAGLYDEKK